MEDTIKQGINIVALLKSVAKEKNLREGRKIHAKIVERGLLAENPYLGSSVINMYAKCGALDKAQEVLDELPVQRVSSWNALISAYARQGHGKKALLCFEQMRKQDLLPNTVTFICILKACGSIEAIEKGFHIHNLLLCNDLLGKDTMLGNVLLDMYAKCGALQEASELICRLHIRDVVSWNTLIAGYVQHGQGQEALKCFEHMRSDGFFPNAVTLSCLVKACGIAGDIEIGKEIHDEIVSKEFLRNDIVLGNALVDMYAKCGALAKAAEVLSQLSIRDVISWNIMTTAYVNQGKGNKAIECFEQMQSEGLSPNIVTYICILRACGLIGDAEKGKQIHDEILSKKLLSEDIMLGNALVDMYVKCGHLVMAEKVLEELPSQNVVSWTTLIAGYAQRGNVEEALNCFKHMQSKGLSPDSITMLCVLNACNHTGLVREGEMHYLDMETKYGLTPNLEHNACMVDLFGRAGRFEKAMMIIDKMPSFDYLPIWSSLLGACRKWGNVKLGRMAFEHAIQLDLCSPAIYDLMSSIYATAGMVDDAAKIESMKDSNTEKSKQL